MTYPTQRKKAMAIYQELNQAIRKLTPEQVIRIKEAFPKNFSKSTRTDVGGDEFVIWDYTPEWNLMESLREIGMKWFTAYQDNTGFPVAQRAFEFIESTSDYCDLKLKNLDDVLYHEITGDKPPKNNWDKMIEDA